jgi:hypothetical protein
VAASKLLEKKRLLLEDSRGSKGHALCLFSTSWSADPPRGTRTSLSVGYAYAHLLSQHQSTTMGGGNLVAFVRHIHSTHDRHNTIM